MVEMGDADAMLTGLTHHYPPPLRPPLKVIGTAPDANYAAGVYMLTFKNRVVFCADATVNPTPTRTPSKRSPATPPNSPGGSTSNRGPRCCRTPTSGASTPTPPRRRARGRKPTPRRPDRGVPRRRRDAGRHRRRRDILEGTYEFSDLDDPANVLVFPNLESGNIAYKLLHRLGNAEAIGPMLVGMDKPVHVLQRGDEVKDIVNLAGVAVVDAQNE